MIEHDQASSVSHCPDEDWMYQLAGVRRPALEPRSCVVVPKDDDDDLADLDALLAGAHRAFGDGDPSPVVPASDDVDDLADLDALGEEVLRELVAVGDRDSNAAAPKANLATTVVKAPEIRRGEAPIPSGAVIASAIPDAPDAETATCPRPPLASASTDVDGLEAAVSGFEKRTGISAPATSAAGKLPGDSSKSDFDWIQEALDAAPGEPLRVPYDVLGTKRNIEKNRALVKRFSSRVTALTWDLNGTSGMADLAKNFHFLPKIYNYSVEDQKIFNIREKVELLPPLSPDSSAAGRIPAPLQLPAWNKLPASSQQTPQLREVITGMRSASIAADGNPGVDTWLSELPGSEVCHLSIDMTGERAERFLTGEKGRPGTTLYRDFLRALERASGGVSLAALWTRPHGAASDVVRLFMTIKMANTWNQHPVAIVDSCHRFHRSLLKHGVPCGSSGKPLRVPHEDMAKYLGMTEDEWYWERQKRSDFVSGSLDDRDLWEYTPESGFATAAEIERRDRQSYARWNKFSSSHGLPQWFGSFFVECLMDHFLYPEAEVRERDRARARIVKRKNLKRTPAASDLAIDERFKKADLLEAQNIRVYQSTPAQFAALAARSGEFLGDYCCNGHKAGSARGLYERVRLNDV